jgi:hypothetical protein
MLAVEVVALVLEIGQLMELVGLLLEAVVLVEIQAQ